LSARARLAAAIAGPALLALALVAAPQAAADPALSYGCNPPLPRTAANCSIWHTSPVTLVWSYGVDFEPAPVKGSDCAKQSFNSDTGGTDVMCAVWDSSGMNLTNATATVRLDMTPPSVTGLTPSRPPDNDGWWNHPLSLAFGGSDATSGISGCDTVNYSGPDSDSADVSGACRDVAGNSATGAFKIKYDATPPTITPLSSEGRAAHVTLKWDTSPDAVLTRVLRSPGIGGAPVSEVYSGTDKAFTDPAVQNGKTYTYTIVTTDPAANAVSTVMVVTPKAQVRRPLLRWRKVKGADYYNVQVYRGRRKILSAWPHGTSLRLRKQWTFRGRRRVLTAGSYHWYVWPGFGRRSAHRYGRLIAHRRFTIKPPS
jgi:hypothetical protein